MELRADIHIPFPRDVVFVAYRDDITKVLAYLPNVRSIEVQVQEGRGRDRGAREHLARRRGIPAAARAVLSESMLSWTDYATWDKDKLRCDWRIETHAFTEAVTCQGFNVFVEDGPGKTMLEMRGKIENRREEDPRHPWLSRRQGGPHDRGFPRRQDPAEPRRDRQGAHEISRRAEVAG